jgi:uncharacterized surface protein with fasciclin (FAS1) repeats
MKIARITTVAVLALALVAAACSSDDSADTTTSVPVTTMAADEMTSSTIVDVATEAGSFSTLLAAAEAAGLVDTLNGAGPFTVFAPTDEAFAALPEGTVEGLLEDPEALAEILLYHVVAGEVPAADVVGLASATTVQGADIAIEVVDGGVVLNGTANVVTTDVDASNGVIHVIDQVILPPAA